MEIKFEELLNLTVGQLASLTNQFLRENPQFKTAQQLLEEVHGEEEAIQNNSAD